MPRPALLSIYPNAPHAFDNPLIPVPPAMVAGTRLQSSRFGRLVKGTADMRRYLAPIAAVAQLS